MSDANYDIEQIQIEFHDKARVIFFTLLEDFESSAGKIDRKKQEYRFQDLKNKYIMTLKQQLESCAMGFIENRKPGKPGELNTVLQNLIREYLHRFVQKTRTG